MFEWPNRYSEPIVEYIDIAETRDLSVEIFVGINLLSELSERWRIFGDWIGSSGFDFFGS